MKFRILAFIAIVAMSGIGSANAETWECSILLGGDHKVTLTQESDPALSDEDYVEGTVTGPYGKKHKASVSIDGFDRRWDYKSKDGSGEYAIFMKPGGFGGFYDFTSKGKGELREADYILVCKQMEERHLAEEEKSETKLPEKGNQRGSNTEREAYVLAIRQKVERNWRKPPGSGRMPICEVTVVQGPGGTILDVNFNACGGSTATYRASIESAVYKAEPFPAPADPALFEREMTFLFNPDQR